MKETEGSCKKRKKKMLDEAHDDGVLLSQENVSTCKKCCNSQITHGRSIKINGSPTSPLLLQGQNCPNRTGPKEPERIANFDQSLASIDTRPSSESKPSVPSNSAPPKGGRSRGLIWVKKPEDDGTEFKIKHLLLKGGNNVDSSDLVCHLCKHPYNSELMYIRCDTCMRWFHAEAVELDESKIFQLVGFKCCTCRRIRSPVCPYDETKKNRPLEKRENVIVQPYCALNALKHDATKVQKQVIKCSSAPKGPLQVPNTAAFKPLSEHDATKVQNQVKCSSAPKGLLQVPDAAAEEVMVTNGTQGATSNHSPSNDEAKEESSIDSTLIDVEGYSVKKELAPMLQRIFDKHKDIARDCKIKSRTILLANLEMICSFCHKLENKTLEDLFDIEVEDMTLVVDDFRHMGFDVEWLSERLKEFSIMKQVIDNKHALNEDKTKIETKVKEVDMLKQKLSIAEAKLATMKVKFDKKDLKISKQIEALKPFYKSLMYGLI